MSGKLLFGLETEYALCGEGRKDILLGELLALVKQRVTHLPGWNGLDFFIENGSRIYADAGSHPELSTPECTNPADVVRYFQAGERILADLVGHLSAGKNKNRMMIYKLNIDYSGAHTSWGSHESYLVSSPINTFPEQLVPHLVSRVIYTGAGGFNPFSEGLEFTLSPRAWHLESVVSGDSTVERAIFHTKNEPLTKTGTNRLHLICGESLCSETSLWLRIGTTALVIAMIDRGIGPGAGVKMRSPIQALHSIVSDPSCKTIVRMSDGRDLSALDIQRHYLHEAEKHLKDLPSWAKKVCTEWRRILDRLEQKPESLCKSLDWAIKYPIYRNYAAKKGINWSDFPAWNHIIKKIRADLRLSEHKGKATVELVLDKEKKPSPIPRTIDQLTPYLARHSLSWDNFRPFVDLMKELFELEIRFGQLGGAGLFNSLDRAGVLDHRAPGVGKIDRAIVYPPKSTRACLRGKMVRMHANHPGYHCTWDSIIDSKGKRQLDLSDPFVRQVEWQKLTGEHVRSLHANRGSRLLMHSHLMDELLGDPPERHPLP